MALRSNRQTLPQPRQQKKRRHRITLTLLERFVRKGWRVLRAVMRAVMACPPMVRAVVISDFLLLLSLGVNWSYQTFHKPTEIFFLLHRTLTKSPAQTWEQYESLFREHATAIITPEFLAALAQIEGGGNPVL